MDYMVLSIYLVIFALINAFCVVLRDEAGIVELCKWFGVEDEGFPEINVIKLDKKEGFSLLIVPLLEAVFWELDVSLVI